MRRDVELLEQVHRRHVHRRREPGDAAGPRVAVDRGVCVGVELHPLPVLEPHRIAARVRGVIDPSQRIGQLATVVVPDFCRDVDRVATAHHAIAERAPGNLGKPEPRVHDHEGRPSTWPAAPPCLNSGQTLRQLMRHRFAESTADRLDALFRYRCQPRNRPFTLRSPFPINPDMCPRTFRSSGVPTRPSGPRPAVCAPGSPRGTNPSVCEGQRMTKNRLRRSGRQACRASCAGHADPLRLRLRPGYHHAGEPGRRAQPTASGSGNGSGSRLPVREAVCRGIQRPERRHHRTIAAYGGQCGDAATIEYNPTGSGAGIKSFYNGLVDFAGSDSVLKTEEKDGVIEADKAKERCQRQPGLEPAHGRRPDRLRLQPRRASTSSC